MSCSTTTDFNNLPAAAPPLLAAASNLLSRPAEGLSQPASLAQGASAVRTVHLMLPTLRVLPLTFSNPQLKPNFASFPRAFQAAAAASNAARAAPVTKSRRVIAGRR